jgi:hypothetical protein
LKIIYTAGKNHVIADAWTRMKETTPGRGQQRPPLFNFDGEEVVAAVDEVLVKELDPVLQKL